ncbi:hypothetical protein AB0C29_38955 [Actinoplanes sp. NPDC048791]|uniref:hypothetical protein n=1 Tax=Actinoplanes sp. NPDC048791 TaxID=3154623 RepID=UPI0033DC2221
MSQDPPQGDWQGWDAQPQQPYPYPYPYPQQVGFDPADPLVSNDFNGWWQRSFRLLKAAWRPMALIQLIVSLPTLVLLLPAMLAFQDEQRVAQESLQASVDAGTQPDFSLFFAGLTVLLPAAAVAGLFYMLGQLANQQVVVFTATGRTGNLVGPALLAAAKRLPMLLGWYLLAIPVLIVATVLCFFPVFYVGAALTVLAVVVLLERGNGIGRCFQLFHASIGVSVARIATIFGLSVGASLLLTLVTTLVDVTLGGSYTTPNSTATVINTLLQTAYYAVSYVVLAPLLVTTYADMRARREPFTTASLLPGTA